MTQLHNSADDHRKAVYCPEKLASLTDGSNTFFQNEKVHVHRYLG
jgi:hypothetical protein